jgi:hypothetical protein
MKQSQFQSFQAMQSDTNISDIREMTKTLGAYGPVMLAHYKPDNSSQSTFESDVRAILTDSYLQEMSGYGLFAISFMDKQNMSNSSSIYNFIKAAVISFGSATAPAVAPIARVTPQPTVSATPTAKPSVTPTVAPSPTALASVSPIPTASTTTAYKGEYFANRYLSGAPVLTRDDASINFDWVMGSPGAGVPADGFSVRWSKQQQFDAGTYRFSTLSDDGIRLYIDNELLIDQWNDHAVMTHTAEKSMSSGLHAIRVEFYDNGYHAVAQMSYAKSGLSTVNPIPSPAVPVVTVAPSPSAAATNSPLSKIQVLAAGTPSQGVYPLLNLVINGNKVATFENIQGNPATRTFQEFSYTTATPIKGTVKLEYTNNGAANGEDRNAFVDKIIVNGVSYETESPTVYSVGSWNQAAGCGGGNKQSEKLHCNGYFQYILP